MSNLGTGILLAVGLVTLAGTAVLGLGTATVPGPGDAVLVVSLPWGDDPAQIVARAGGHEIAPVPAPLAVLASGATVEAFKAAGAVAVLPAAVLAMICES